MVSNRKNTPLIEINLQNKIKNSKMLKDGEKNNFLKYFGYLTQDEKAELELII